MGWSRLDLGVGVIALGSLDQLWSWIQDLVDVVEVEPQTLWESRFGGGRVISPEPLAWLRACERPLLSHGVGFPVGGTTPPDHGGVLAAAESARVLGAVHWSEHLAFNAAGESYAGYLLPPVQSPAGVAAAVQHITAYQGLYDRPFLVETPTNYLQPVPGDLNDGEYVAAIAEQADCGILLDLHNIWTNQRNGRQSVADFLAELPLERVWEVHLAGGFETNGYYLDAHVGPIDPELLDLAAEVLPRLPRVRAIIYEAVPASLAAQGVDGLREVLGSMHRIAELPAVEGPPPFRPGRRTMAPPADGVRSTPGRSTPDREAELLAYTTRASDELAVADPGADLIRGLTDQSRLSLLVRHQGPLLGALLKAFGTAKTEAVLTEFLAASPASAWRDEQTSAFTAWLTMRPDLVALIAPASAELA
ncbi:MAG: hypothetical protein JWM76_3292 [Pseudonocardiales bacterium]|nr:hypothetical protein [Pseudonocardiales bacterium]